MRRCARPVAYVFRYVLALVLAHVSLPAAAGTWSAGAQLSQARAYHTATLLADGRVLVAGGTLHTSTGNPPRQHFFDDVADAEIYDPRSGKWLVTGKLRWARRDHAAVRLADGRVLVVGGTRPSSAELYDPASGTWSETEALPSPHGAYVTATLLGDGRVLVLGGGSADAHLFSAASATWTSAAPLPLGARSAHTATLLRSGKVLVAGGGSQTAEVYDPAGDSWSDAGVMIVARDRHTATLLGSGKVLVAAGPSWTNTAEIFDPDTLAWMPAASLAIGRNGHAAVLLPDGRVLVAGGIDQVPAEIYSPTTNTWVIDGRLAEAVTGTTMTVLPSGLVLSVGGDRWDGSWGSYRSMNPVDLYDPRPGTWLRTPDKPAGGQDSVTSALELLPEQNQVVAAGIGQLFNVRDGSFEAVNNPVDQELRGFTTTLLADGQVLLAGGYTWQGLGFGRSEAYLYDPAARRWDATTSMRQARRNHHAVLLGDGRVLVFDGVGAEVFDPKTRVWRATGPLVESAVGSGGGVMLAGGQVLACGGVRSTGFLRGCQVFDPDTERWSETPAVLNQPHAGLGMTMLRDGRVLATDGFVAELFDPGTGRWSLTGAPGQGIGATSLLPDGRVLGLSTTSNWPALLYNPGTEAWSAGNPCVTAPSACGCPVPGVDPSTCFQGSAWGLQSTMLPDFRVFAINNPLPIDQVCEDCLRGQTYGAVPAAGGRRPSISSLDSNTLRYGNALTIRGSGLAGDSEAASGSNQSSSARLTIVQLYDPERRLFFDVLPSEVFPDRLVLRTLPPGLNVGQYLLWAIASGVPSAPRVVSFECSLGDATVDAQPPMPVGLGTQVTFTALAQGARRYQWQQSATGRPDDWRDIPGATAQTYRTPPLTAGDAGVQYRVKVVGACGSLVNGVDGVDFETSPAAALRIDAPALPQVLVEYPSGGEYWFLSDPDPTKPRNQQVVSFRIEDDLPICDLRVSLWTQFLGDAAWREIDVPATGLAARFAAGDWCPFPGVAARQQTYTVPVEFPAGRAGALYKVKVEATNHAGKVASAESRFPFYVVEPNDQSVRTLILANLPQMARVFPAADYDELRRQLDVLARDENVRGFVINLDQVGSLVAPYAAWNDALARGDADDANLSANELLFGPAAEDQDQAGGVHRLVTDLVQQGFTGVKHLVIVGDDRVIPMARVPDSTALLREDGYTAVPPPPLVPDLTPSGTTAGMAASKLYFLSDDPMAYRGKFNAQAVDKQTYFGPDYGIGRLVETPEQIVGTISIFSSKRGVLDVSPASVTNKVQVTGYDFFNDSARVIRERWRAHLGDASDPSTSTSPVDGVLIGGSPAWGVNTVAERVDLLRAHLQGNGGDGYGILSLNGHASHFLEGVPGLSPADINGVDTAAVAALDLTGSFVYATGCHAGLPVGGGGADDHPLDLPEAFLAAGAVAYVGNSGYGWGLLEGIGYGERLAQLLTEELTGGFTVEVGEAVRRVKSRYLLEGPRLDAYDFKSSMQWTLYGLPMYAVTTVSGAPLRAGGGGTSSYLDGPAPERSALAARERLGPIVVERPAGGGDSLAGLPGEGVAGELPAFLTRLDLRFDLSAAGVYRKWKAVSGEEILDPSVACADVAPFDKGCYYTLNGIVERATGTTDRALEPFFIYDSRLLGTSQHGVLWKGGSYREEGDWIPVKAQLSSNLLNPATPGVAPSLQGGRGAPSLQGGRGAPAMQGGRGAPGNADGRTLMPRITPSGEIILDGCPTTDFELSTLVVTTGELVEGASPAETRHRNYQTVELEVLYYNDTRSGEGNCDVEGPTFKPGPYAGGKHHTFSGTGLELAVPVDDPQGGIWRVVVLYSDAAIEADGLGHWRTVELVDDGAGGCSATPSATERCFRSSAPLDISQMLDRSLTYLLQAVDNRGNVSFLPHEPAAADLGESGVDPLEAEPVAVTKSCSAVATPASASCDGIQLQASVDDPGAGRLGYAWESACAATFTPSASAPDPVVTFGSSCALACAITLKVTSDGAESCADRIEVTVDDRSAPLLTLPADRTIECTEARDPGNTGLATASDNCASPALSFDDRRDDGACPDGFDIVRTWVATDSCANTTRGDQRIAVRDRVAPALAGVPADVTVECGEVPLPSAVTASDACDPNLNLTMTETRTPGSCGQGYVLTRTWSARDRCGNVVSASQAITVRDTRAPVLLGVPGDLSVECSALPPAAPVGASDGCDPAPSVTLAETRLDGSCPDSYTLTRTWTARDSCGNQTQASQVLAVRDTVGPAIAGVPANATAECSDLPPAPSPTASDACDPAPALAFSETRTDLTCADDYLQTRTWTATDRCGNVTREDQLLTILDRTRPEAGAMLVPKAPLSPRSPLAACSSVGSEQTFQVVCTASDNCDPAPATEATLVVTVHDVDPKTSECIVKTQRVPVGCDGEVTLRLLAPPCPESDRRGGECLVSVEPDGTLAVVGESVVLEVMATDRCDNEASASFDPSVEPAPDCGVQLPDGTCCPAIAQPGPERCEVEPCRLAPARIAAPRPGGGAR